MNDQEIDCIYCGERHSVKKACIRNEWHGECETTAIGWCKRCECYIDQPNVCESCGKYFCDHDDHKPQPYSDIWLCVECIHDDINGGGLEDGDVQVLVETAKQVVAWIEKAPIDKLENIEAELGELFPITELKEVLVKVQE